MLNKLAVLGAGSWGTVLAYLFSRRASQVSLWSRASPAAEALRASRENARYLPGVRLPSNVHPTSDLLEAVRDAAVVVLAVPSFAVEETCQQARSVLPKEALILSGAKGLESSGHRISQIVESVIPGVGLRLVVLSGPNLAREMAAEMPTATVVASHNPSASIKVQEALCLPQFRIYTNPDVIGVELGGALKNIVAIAAGITDGLGYGENTKAALMSRGLHEIRRLGRALGALDATFSGLSGIGDLYATCASNKSRNHRVGFELGRGRKLPEILEEVDQVAEGVQTTQAALVLARREQVEMPIARALETVLFHGADPRETVNSLMSRAPSAEIDL